MRVFKKPVLGVVLGLALVAGMGQAAASGMQPRTSVVLIREADGEAEMIVRNTDPTVALLYTAVVDLPGDSDTLVIATPAVARVEAGEEQLVRFVYQGPPLVTQHLKRVTFEGIGPSRDDQGEEQATVGVGVRYDLPMILHPRGLPDKVAPWEGLAWHRDGKELVVSNDTAYVVRLQPYAVLAPSQQRIDLPRPYILPGETLRLATEIAPSDTAVTLHPVSLQGYAVAAYDAPLK